MAKKIMPALFIFLLRLVRGIRDGLKEPEFRGLFWSVVIILLSGTWFYHAVEGWSWLDAFYFSVITLTTVGYGDFSPQTAVGKIFTVVYIVLGLGVLSSFLLLLANYQPTDSPTLLSRLKNRGKRPSDEPSTEE
ncbi:MAG: two pore domain potassium channel family protein [Anaerolineales bacterium]|nr:two pore domain potassium channel family protein [Anaerolineales bacterium]